MNAFTNLHELCTLLRTQIPSFISVLNPRCWQNIQKNEPRIHGHLVGVTSFLLQVEKAVSSGTPVCLKQVKWRKETVPELRTGTACANIHNEWFNKTTQRLFHMKKCPFSAFHTNTLKGKVRYKQQTFPKLIPLLLWATGSWPIKGFWWWCMANKIKGLLDFDHVCYFKER
jgi:hypothetical protein